MKQPKILIIDTQPFNKMVQSRALDSYFHQFSKENLMQIFSDSRIPCKGQCDVLYQITDKDLFIRRFNKRHKVGKIFHYSNLPIEWGTEQRASKAPKKKIPIYRFLRKFIWKQKYWATEELNDLVSNFKPDFIFVGFSKDFFIFDIALYFSNKLNIPIIPSIADDYVFFDEYRGHFLNFIYRKMYLSIVDECFKKTAFCIFESEKIKTKYLSEFNIRGEVIYISTELSNKTINVSENNNFCYAGNLEYGRAKSLIDIANILLKMDKNIIVDVYSKDCFLFQNYSIPINLILHNQIPYDEVILKMKESRCLIIVEGFGKENVEMTRYSLSTKVADTLSFAKPIIVYGDSDSGAIGFFIENNIGYVATSYSELEPTLAKAIKRLDFHTILNKQLDISSSFFDLETQSKKFMAIVCDIMEKND